ncbi:DUF2917 domain-containing protein, partial [Klebsiella pneumoniae]|nr:DUF2917 domain-containing protein [Klebsiella pneumoniae]
PDLRYSKTADLLCEMGRLRAYLARRCQGHAMWAGHEALSDTAFLARHGLWRGPFAEGTVFFYLDEFIKDAPKDLLTLLACTCDTLEHLLRSESTLVQQNIDALGQLLQLNAAERALLLYGTLARYQRELRVLEGRVWVTQRGALDLPSDDYWLEAGDALDLPHGAELVIEAWPQARFQLLVPPQAC